MTCMIHISIICQASTHPGVTLHDGSVRSFTLTGICTTHTSLHLCAECVAITHYAEAFPPLADLKIKLKQSSIHSSKTNKQKTCSKPLELADNKSMSYCMEESYTRILTLCVCVCVCGGGGGTSNDCTADDPFQTDCAQILIKTKSFSRQL